MRLYRGVAFLQCRFLLAAVCLLFTPSPLKSGSFGVASSKMKLRWRAGRAGAPRMSM